MLSASKKWKKCRDEGKGGKPGKKSETTRELGCGDGKSDTNEHESEGIAIRDKLCDGDGGEEDGVKIKGREEGIPRKKDPDAEQKEG